MSNWQATGLALLAIAGLLVSPLIILRLAALVGYGWAKGKQKFDDRYNHERDRDNGRK